MYSTALSHVAEYTPSIRARVHIFLLIPSMTSTEKKMRGERGPGAHWRLLHLQADSLASGKDMARATGRWTAARRCQGDGKRSYVFECKEHTDCEVKRRVALGKDNMFHVYEKGEHAQSVNNKKRKNSAMDEEQEKELLCDIWKGVKPAGSRLAMTLQKESELLEAGLDPADYKRSDEEGGGLLGARSACLHVSIVHSDSIVVIF